MSQLLYNLRMYSKKRNVFVFFIGEKSKISKLISSLPSSEFNIVLGPSTEDHEYLYANYAYYRKSYDEKIWSFCSDVWRFYMLSKNVGIYIDTSVKVGKNFMDFYDRNIINNVTLFKETSSSIATSVMFSGVKNNIFFKNMLNLYSEDINFSPRLVPIAPKILSATLRKTCEYYGFDQISIEKIKILSLLEIRNENEVIKIGSSSWTNNNTVDMNILEDNNFWKASEVAWASGKDHEKFVRREHIYINLSERQLNPTPQIIRENYEKSKSKYERKYLSKLYKEVTNYRIRLFDRLIWSKIYVFFTKIFAKLTSKNRD